MAAKPKAHLLPSGDILVPVRVDDGRWRMVRLSTDDVGYTEQLAALRKRERTRKPGYLTWFLWFVVLLIVLYALALLVFGLTHAL